MDRSPLMLKKAQENLSKNFPHEVITRTEFVDGSILDTPFGADTFDLVFAMRIYHHFPEQSDRIKILRELQRIGKKWIILSFYNAHSYQHLRRVLKTKIRGRQSYRFAIGMAQFKRELAQADLHLHSYFCNARWFSEQTLTLLQIQT